MARKDLSLLTSRVDEMKETLVPPATEAAAPVAAVPTATPGRKPRPASPPRSGAVTEEYERKETWLRADQTAELDALAKRLQRAKDPSEKTRITANTIIRVAVDALLEHTDELRGDTEAQIRESVTTRVAGK